MDKSIIDLFFNQTGSAAVEIEFQSDVATSMSGVQNSSLTEKLQTAKDVKDEIKSTTCVLGELDSSYIQCKTNEKPVSTKTIDESKLCKSRENKALIHEHNVDTDLENKVALTNLLPTTEDTFVSNESDTPLALSYMRVSTGQGKKFSYQILSGTNSFVSKNIGNSDTLSPVGCTTTEPTLNKTIAIDIDERSNTTKLKKMTVELGDTLKSISQKDTNWQPNKMPRASSESTSTGKQPPELTPLKDNKSFQTNEESLNSTNEWKLTPDDHKLFCSGILSSTSVDQISYTLEITRQY